MSNALGFDEDFMATMLGDFLDESQEYLCRLNSNLLLLDDASRGIGDHDAVSLSPEMINTMFRDAHSLKGLSAMLQLHDINGLTHKIENVFEAIRGSKINVTRTTIDVMFKAIDQLTQMIEHLKDDSSDSVDIAPIVKELSTLLEVRQANVDASYQVDFATIVDEEQIPANYISLCVDETLDTLDEISDLLFSQGANRVTALLTLFHRIKGSASAIGLNRIAHLAHLIEDLLQENANSSDELEVYVIDAIFMSMDKLREALRLTRDANDPSAALEATHEAILNAAANRPPRSSRGAKVAMVDPPAQEENVEVKDLSIQSRDVTDSSEADAKKEHEPPSSSDSDGKAAKDRPAETVRVDIDRLDQLMNLAGQLVINKSRFGQIAEELRAITSRRQATSAVNTILASLERFDGALSYSDADADPKQQLSSEFTREHVMQIKDCIRDIAGELDKLTKARSIYSSMVEANHQLERIANGIQTSVMDTRMVPIGPLFGRFKRIVRDICRATEKDIELVIRGDKTELDKRMIDELADPLIHMVRNSADHGIEKGSERIALGKPAQGTITLDAFHRGNRIMVQVKDDGKGLNPELILAKAISKGLVSEAEAERLTTSQILNLIWEPGFSTAEKITEVSGRGMGMDIVRSKIELLNGKIDVQSEIGVGTTITIQLPLTLAILPSLLISIEQAVYAIPVESVTEIVSIQPSHVYSIHGQMSVTVRNRTISVIDLPSLFRSVNTCRPLFQTSKEEILVIVGNHENEVGILVDHLLGEDDIVIKSLAENFRNVEGIAGASILGDGRVTLILDIPSIQNLALGAA
jgi:two-component system chemotaxis sensor kinase CheA